MKFILPIITNCLVILCSILFFVDHPFFSQSTSGKIRQGLLLGFACYIGYDLLYIYILKKNPVQSGLLYKLFSALQKSWYSTQTFIQPVQKEFLISLLIAIVLIAIGFVLSGLPGGILITVMKKIGLLQSLRGDSIWPTALLLSFLWPLCFPFAVLAKQYFVHQGYMGFTGFIFVLGMGWIILILSLISLSFTGTKS